MADSITEVVYTVLEVLLALVCCLGNLLVIWTVWKCGAMRHQPTFRFIVSLAIADFLVGSVVVPVRILTDSRVQMPFYGCLVLSCGIIFFTQVALTANRFLRVIIPVRYKSTVTLKLCWWVVATCWLMAAVVGSIPLMGWNNSSSASQNSTECQFLNVMSMSYLVYFYFYTCILLPLLVMTALYSCIFTLIHLQLRRASIGVSQHYFQKERNLTCSLVLVLALFATCWLPIHLIKNGSFFLDTISQANSAINPIVYAFKIHPIKAPLKSIWRRFALAGKQELKASSNSQLKGADNSSNIHNIACDILAKRTEATKEG